MRAIKVSIVQLNRYYSTLNTRNRPTPFLLISIISISSFPTIPSPLSRIPRWQRIIKSEYLARIPFLLQRRQSRQLPRPISLLQLLVPARIVDIHRQLGISRVLRPCISELERERLSSYGGRVVGSIVGVGHYA